MTTPSRPALHLRCRDAVAFALLLGPLLAGCGRQETAETAKPTAAVMPAGKAEEPSPPAAEESTTSELRISDLIGNAQKRLKAGAFDEAAAELLRVQAASSRISAEESASYRDTMGQAMSATVEAAQKGDTRALAALQMLRAARGR